MTMSGQTGSAPPRGVERATAPHCRAAGPDAAGSTGQGTRDLVLVDIDGLIADLSPWSHLVSGPPPQRDWPAFFAHIPHAAPIVEGVDLVRMLAGDGFAILYSTTRPAYCWTATIEWLRQHRLPRGWVRTRNPSDTSRRPSWHVKRGHWNEARRLPVVRCGFVDDEAEAVKLLREVGTPAWELSELLDTPRSELSSLLRSAPPGVERAAPAPSSTTAGPATASPARRRVRTTLGEVVIAA